MNSVVIKQKSQYHEHFYRGLVAGDHYLEVEKNLSNIDTVISYAESNPEKMIDMVKKSRAISQKLLEPASVLCYHAEFFRRWSAKQSRDVKIDDDMERISKKHSRPNWSCKKCQNHLTESEFFKSEL